MRSTLSSLWCYFRSPFDAILEKKMATHSSILAWRIPGTEEPGGLPSMGSYRVGHNWSYLACVHALEKEMETHSSILARRIPGTEKPGGLPSVGSHRVRHDWHKLAAAAADAILDPEYHNPCEIVIIKTITLVACHQIISSVIQDLTHSNNKSVLTQYN